MRLNKPINEVEIFPINPARGIWSFLNQPGTSPIRVRVPKGSILREIKHWGVELSVTTADERVRRMWSANEVMRAALTEEGGRFSLKKPQYKTAG